MGRDRETSAHTFLSTECNKAGVLRIKIVNIQNESQTPLTIKWYRFVDVYRNRQNKKIHDTFTLGLKKSKTNLGEKIRLFFKT